MTITTHTTIADVIEMLCEDDFDGAATEAGYREHDALPRCAAYERPTPEAFGARKERALRRTAREIRTAGRKGALLWTAEHIITTDASRLHLEVVEATDIAEASRKRGVRHDN